MSSSKYHCDFHGTCKNKPYCEVYRSLLGGKYANSGWNYLCRKHFYQEQKKFKGKLPWCSVSRKKTKELHVANDVKWIGKGKFTPLSEIMKKYAPNNNSCSNIS